MPKVYRRDGYLETLWSPPRLDTCFGGPERPCLIDRGSVRPLNRELRPCGALRVIHRDFSRERSFSVGPLKSAEGRRTVPLLPMVANALREWRLACPRSDLDLVL